MTEKENSRAPRTLFLGEPSCNEVGLATLRGDGIVCLLGWRLWDDVFFFMIFQADSQISIKYMLAG